MNGTPIANLFLFLFLFGGAYLFPSKRTSGPCSSSSAICGSKLAQSSY